MTNLLKGNYLTLIAGKGEKSRYFTALKKDEFHQKQPNSTFITLIAENSLGWKLGSMFFSKVYRSVKLQKSLLVKNKVHIALHIDSDYASLIKSENRFYVTGSATAELTESGLTFQSLSGKTTANWLDQFYQ